MSGTGLAGWRSVVTGAGGGLGRAIAFELAARGGRVVAADVNLARAEETAAEICARHGADRAVAFSCDVRSADAVGALATFAEAKLGGVELLVNNAGVAVGGRAGEIPLEDWRHVIEVNLWGVIHGCETFVPRFRRAGRGHLLNVASAAGLLSPPRIAPYNVTKAAVVALSETLFAELRGERIGVTVLCPTFFRTGILDASRGSDEAERALVQRLMDRSRVQAPEVARYALRAVEKGRLYALPMWDGSALWLLKRAMPQLFGVLSGRLRDRLVAPPR